MMLSPLNMALLVGEVLHTKDEDLERQQSPNARSHPVGMAPLFLSVSLQVIYKVTKKH